MSKTEPMLVSEPKSESNASVIQELQNYLAERQWRQYFSEHEWLELINLNTSDPQGLPKLVDFWSRLLTSWDTRSLEPHRPVYEQVRDILARYAQLLETHQAWPRTELDNLRLSLAETQVQLQQKQLLFWRFEHEQKQLRVRNLSLENEQAQAEFYNLSELTQFVGENLKEKNELIEDALDGLMGVLDAHWTALYIYADASGQHGTFYRLRHQHFEVLEDFAFPHTDFWNRFWRAPLNQAYIHDIYEPVSELEQLFPNTWSLLAQTLKMPNDGRGLLLACSEEPMAFSGFRQLFNIFGSHIASYLQNAHLHAQINELAIRDALTGVFNRGHLEERLDYSFELSRRYNRELSVLMIDIDYFKLLNDTYGHQFGDQVLIKVAETLQQRLRSTDIIGRYGGEEFLAILQETGVSGALIVSEDLVRMIEKLSFQPESGETVHVTISVGFAAFPDHVPTVDKLVKMADDGLYQAKKNGRNQVGFTGSSQTMLQ